MVDAADGADGEWWGTAGRCPLSIESPLLFHYDELASLA